MASLDEISRAIGGLQANVEHLARTVGPLGELASDVKEIKIQVAAMQPVVAKVNRWEQRMIGVSATVSAIITVVGASIYGKVREWLG